MQSLPVTIPTTRELQDRFVEVLPRIQRCAAFAFRGVHCHEQRAECAAEVVAICWRWFIRLAQRGKDATQFASTLASLAGRAVKSGRRLANTESATDVLSLMAPQRHGIRVESLPQANRRAHGDLYGLARGQRELDAYEERLCDNMVTPPPDAAAFRLDFPRFLERLSQRDRSLAGFLSLGHSATAAAEQFALTPGRVTQLRQRWWRDWHRFHQESLPLTGRLPRRRSHARILDPYAEGRSTVHEEKR